LRVTLTFSVGSQTQTVEVSAVSEQINERAAVEKHLRFARNLRIETQILAGKDVPETVVEFARRTKVSQIFVARSQGGLSKRLLGRSDAEDIVRIAHDLQVTVVADRGRRQAP
jgi:K+-sensing histidine kinase KdpD